jgi:hypothetical protein
MGMGSFAVGSFVIEYKDLKKLCPAQIKAIEKAPHFKSVGWYSIGRWLAWDNPEEVIEPIYECANDDEQATEEIFEQYESLIQSLKNTFNKKTGLTLYFDSYDEEGGDRYDNPGDKDGCIFCVDGMVQLTPAGKRFKDIITERKWTQFG